MKPILAAVGWLALIAALFVVSPWLGVPALVVAGLLLWSRINDARDSSLQASIAAGAKELSRRQQEAAESGSSPADSAGCSARPQS